MAQVVLEKLSKTFPGGVAAVRDLSLTVADGEWLVLVGPSGCGKTTTLRLIAGLDQPTIGAVRIGGNDVTAWPPWRRDVAMTFQRPALYPHRSVRANLAFGLALAQRRGSLRRLLAWPFLAAVRKEGRNRRQDLRHRVAEAARVLGLQDVLDRQPAQLSGGQQQRVALGRALVRRPAVFLLDEPLGNLDARLRSDLRRELLLLRRHFPATMIHVTHDPVEALTLGDRLAVLRDGMLQQVGPPREVYRRPENRFVAGFVGWLPTGFLDGEVCRRADSLYFVGEGAALPLPTEKSGWVAWVGRPATLGIRAEDVQLEEVEGRLGDGDARLDVEVSLREPLGRTSLATCTRGGWRLAALAMADGPAEGQTGRVVMDLRQAHLFDRVSGRALDAGFHTG
jgi:multiple sugar transport system ATP-binding protein